MAPANVNVDAYKTTLTAWFHEDLRLRREAIQSLEVAQALNSVLSVAFGLFIIPNAADAYDLTSITRAFGADVVAWYKYVRLYIIHFVPLICSTLLTFSSKAYYLSDDWWINPSVSTFMIFANYVVHQLQKKDVYIVIWESQNNIYPISPFMTLTFFTIGQLLSHAATTFITNLLNAQG